MGVTALWNFRTGVWLRLIARKVTVVTKAGNGSVFKSFWDKGLRVHTKVT